MRIGQGWQGEVGSPPPPLGSIFKQIPGVLEDGWTGLGSIQGCR